MTNRRAQARSIAALSFAALVLALSSCATPSAPTGELSGAPEANASTEPGDPVSGVGPTGFPGVDMPIPSKSRSATILFACTGGDRFTVELGDSMMLGQSPVPGTCDGESELSWPISAETGPSLSVFIPEGVKWIATPEFSTDEFLFDEAMTSVPRSGHHG